MMQDEDAQIAGIADEAGFVAFVRHLADERLLLEQARREGRAEPGFLSGLGDWEYDSLSGYLDAIAAAWEAGIRPDGENPWQRAARILQTGKYYE